MPDLGHRPVLDPDGELGSDPPETYGPRVGEGSSQGKAGCVTRRENAVVSRESRWLQGPTMRGQGTDGHRAFQGTLEAEQSRRVQGTRKS